MTSEELKKLAAAIAEAVKKQENPPAAEEDHVRSICEDICSLLGEASADLRHAFNVINPALFRGRDSGGEDLDEFLDIAVDAAFSASRAAELASQLRSQLFGSAMEDESPPPSLPKLELLSKPAKIEPVEFTKKDQLISKEKSSKAKKKKKEKEKE
jgi:hypothetical protein